MRQEHDRGGSYVEILLALALFVTAGAAILGAYMAMSDLSDHATLSMKAVTDLEAVMERIASTSFPNVTTQFPDGVANGGVSNPYATMIGGYTLPGEQITVTYPSQTANRLEIVATLAWTHRSRARSTVFSTVKTKG